MAYRTVADAIIEVARNVSLVNGQGMTPYSDDLIVSLLAQAHDFIINEPQIWPSAAVTFTRVLDGVTGRITQGIPTVANPSDVNRVYHESSMKPLPLVSGYANPLIATSPRGYSLLPTVDDPGPNFLLLQFYPVTLTGNVLIVAKETYDFTDRELVIPIDFWSHVWRASYQYAINDGTNPAQIESFGNNYNDKLRLVKAKINSRPVSMDPYAAYPDLWTESDDPYWGSD